MNAAAAYRGKARIFGIGEIPYSHIGDFADFPPWTLTLPNECQEKGTGLPGHPFPSARPAVAPYHSATSALGFLHFEVPDILSGISR